MLYLPCIDYLYCEIVKLLKEKQHNDLGLPRIAQRIAHPSELLRTWRSPTFPALPLHPGLLAVTVHVAVDVSLPVTDSVTLTFCKVLPCISFHR